jgi:hypothetical protein
LDEKVAPDTASTCSRGLLERHAVPTMQQHRGTFKEVGRLGIVKALTPTTLLSLTVSSRGTVPP